MTLVNARAAFEKAIRTAVVAADKTVSVVFDNMPFTAPGKTKKYVLVTINFDQATIQPHGAAIDQYAGTVQCGIFTPRNKGSAAAAATLPSSTQDRLREDDGLGRLLRADESPLLV